MALSGDFGPAIADCVKREPLIIFTDGVPEKQSRSTSAPRLRNSPPVQAGGVSSGAGTHQPSRISFELQISRFW